MLQSEEFEDETYESEELDVTNTEEVFAHAETHYNQFMNDPENLDPSKCKFLQAYTALFDQFYHTCEKHKSLTKSNGEIDLELASKRKQLENTQQIICNDKRLIEELSRSVVDSHHLIDTLHSREQDAYEVIDNFRRTICHLQDEIDFKEKLKQQDEETSHVNKHRQGVERERDALIVEVHKMNEKLEAAWNYQEELELKTDATDKKIIEMGAELHDTSYELQRFKHKKELLELELYETDDAIEDVRKNIETLQKQANEERTVLVERQSVTKKKAEARLKCARLLDGCNARLNHFQDDFDKILEELKHVKADQETMNKTLRQKNQTNLAFLQDVSKMARILETSVARETKLASQFRKGREEREKYRLQLTAIEEEVFKLKHERDSDRRAIEWKIHEQIMLTKEIKKFKTIHSKTLEHIHLSETTRKNKTLELEEHETLKRKQLKQIAYLEREREHLLEETMEFQLKMEDYAEDLRVNKNNVYDLKKQVTKDRHKQLQFDNIFDACKADRKLLTDSLFQMQAHRANLANQMLIRWQYNEKAQNDIGQKFKLIRESEEGMIAITREKVEFDKKLETNNNEIRCVRNEILTSKINARKMKTSLGIYGINVSKQMKSIKMLNNEKNVLIVKLMDRNNELAMIYDKLKIIKRNLDAGGKKYTRLLEDIHVLKVEVKRVRTVNRKDSVIVGSYNDLQREIFHIDRDMTREQIKISRQELGLGMSMNIHRWRRLESIDPYHYKLLVMISILQARLVQQQKTFDENKQKLCAVTILYTQLRKMISKQPKHTAERLQQNQEMLAKAHETTKFLLGKQSRLLIDNNQAQLVYRQVCEEVRSVQMQILQQKLGS